ncbi:NADP-dependent malic enzyme [Phaeovibrio sulfidiphilus]|uniref:NADP-dependent malic enzyme n=1 Tax=Phaeovibrio sulfidiphilus TaxID=1220600 RepID=UPI0018D885FD|nr:NADP-dependent malic enzyme [Phaeovibrio sulfidiphilus]
MSNKKENNSLEREALLFHSKGRPGKVEIHATKPLATQRDLSLAYSPGVAFPCLEIQRNPDAAYDYTAKGNIVAVISNGTAVLGLGDLGALAGKPVMEGKAVLFKTFADVDAIDLEVDTTDVDAFVNCVRYLGPSFGGINLEDIKAPECFVIESRLREIMDIPVFHDDQHGTAIIATAGMLNALELTGRDIRDVRLVVNGAGAAAIACVELVKAAGVPPENVIMCDTKGVIHTGRKDLNQWKSAHAVDTPLRTLAQALEGADAFYGLSAKGAVTPDMIATMARNPIVFAMANPDPEITPEEVRAVRDDAIMATGRSDYPNQINNVLGFPYIFRGALDVRARTINDEMKIAAARAIASLAKEDVPDEVAAAYAGRTLRFGPEYIIPVPFDPRLIAAIPPAVAKAAMDSGVARKPIFDLQTYKRELSARLDPSAVSMQAFAAKVAANPRRVVFAEGEEEKVIRAALAFRNAGYGTPILVGREELIREKMRELGIRGKVDGIEIQNAFLSPHTRHYAEFLYRRLQRRGFLQRDVTRLVNRDRVVFAACMVALEDADALVAGTTRHFHACLEDIQSVIEPTPNELVFSVTLMISRRRTVFLADTNVLEAPTSEQLADIAIQTAALARRMGHEPRVAMLSYSTFGAPRGLTPDRSRQAVQILERRNPNFEFDGEIAAHVALDADLLAHYPFCRLSAPANVLIMPGLQSASISASLMSKMGGATMIGPLLIGLSKPCQIVPMGATVSDILHMATVAASEVS